MSQTPTVFLIDDDLGVLRSLQFLIESHEYQVKTFSSGQEFLNHFDETSRGCVVTDISMPGMNGIELRSAILKKGWQLPVILISGHHDLIGELEGESDSFQEVISKPINSEKLISCIKQSLAIG